MISIIVSYPYIIPLFRRDFSHSYFEKRYPHDIDNRAKGSSSVRSARVQRFCAQLHVCVVNLARSNPQEGAALDGAYSAIIIGTLRKSCNLTTLGVSVYRTPDVSIETLIFPIRFRRWAGSIHRSTRSSTTVYRPSILVVVTRDQSEGIAGVLRVGSLQFLYSLEGCCGAR